MSKSVLVIDTPKTCYSCFLHEPVRNWLYCAVKLKRIEAPSGKPDWCPLKPLPEKNKAPKVASGYELGYEDGWNKCLTEIQGGADDEFSK